MRLFWFVIGYLIAVVVHGDADVTTPSASYSCKHEPRLCADVAAYAVRRANELGVKPD